jgi:hypothetical protein
MSAEPAPRVAATPVLSIFEGMTAESGFQQHHGQIWRC